MSNHQQDVLTCIDTWIPRLEDLATRLLAVIQPADLNSAKAADLHLKYITALTRLLELRQQFNTETTNSADLLLKLVNGELPGMPQDRGEMDGQPPTSGEVPTTMVSPQPVGPAYLLRADCVPIDPI